MTQFIALSPDPGDNHIDYPRSVRRHSSHVGSLTEASFLSGAPSPAYQRSKLEHTNSHSSKRVSVGDARICVERKNRFSLGQPTLEDPTQARVFFPRQPFDGADEHWWVPRFSVEEFENVYQTNQFVYRRRRFRSASAIVAGISLAWLIYLGSAYSAEPHIIVGPLLFVISYLMMWAMSYHRLFKVFERRMARLFAFCLTVGCLAMNAYSERHISLVGRFSIVINVLIILYTVLPLPSHHALAIGVAYSVLHEIVEKTVARPLSSAYSTALLVVCKVLLHVSIHGFLLYNSYMLEVLSRNTFWQLGHSLLYQHDLTFELQLKEKMINSMMPQRFSDELLAGDISKSVAPVGSTKDTLAERADSVVIGFRQLNLYKQDNVSILFADIVGFTRMSSNKSASDLVSLLNNLFRRFDSLALITGCEKISTLGDCYYCVAGCPEACVDHADRCVRMGLSILYAIRDFCKDTNESVDMRVGIHTGSVLCGIVGKKRIKFDVFSNDVRQANQLESSGVAGKVHISEATYNSLLEKDYFVCEKGDVGSRNPAMEGMVTYLLQNVPTHDLLEEENSQLQRINEGASTSLSRQSQSRPASPDISGSLLHRQLSAAKPALRDSPSFMPSSSVHAIRFGSTRSTHSFSSTMSLPSPSGGFRRRQCSLPSSPRHRNRANLCSESSAGTPCAMSSFELGERHAVVPASPAVHRSSLVTEMVARQSRPIHSRKTSNTETTDRGAATNHSAMLDGVTKQMRRMVNIFEGCDSWLVTGGMKEEDGFHSATLTFKDPLLEARYRTQIAKDGGLEEWSTFDSPRFTVLLQALMCVMYFLFSCSILFLLFSDLTFEYPMTFGILLALLIGLLGLTAAATYPCLVSRKIHRFLNLAMSWTSLNFLSVFLIFSPAAAVFVSLPHQCPQSNFDTFDGTIFLFFLVQATLIQCLSFTNVHSVVKIIATLLIGVSAIVMVTTGCSSTWHRCVATNSPQDRFGVTDRDPVNGTTCQYLLDDSVTYEIVFSILLLVLVLNFLNRELEIGARLSFSTNILAQVKFCEIEDQKFQADLLLNNIVPDHVVAQLQVCCVAPRFQL